MGGFMEHHSCQLVGPYGTEAAEDGEDDGQGNVGGCQVQGVVFGTFGDSAEPMEEAATATQQWRL